MGIFSNLFGWGSKKKSNEVDTQSQIEEFMSLIGTYSQALIVSHLGITDLKMVPDFAMYKRILRIPTVGGKLGLAEKAHIKKLMIAEYKMDESFFKEIDSSIRKNCKNVRNVQSYFFAFGNFTNGILSFLYTQYQWKLQGSMLFRRMLRSTVRVSVNKMMTKGGWKDAEVAVEAQKLRAAALTLGYSNAWMTEFAYQILIQSKKRKKK